MELEQIIKKLEWLDEEHRKDKIAFNKISDQIARTESSINVLNNQQKKIIKDSSKFTAIQKKLNQAEKDLEVLKEDINNKIKDLGDSTSEGQLSLEKKINLEINGINKSLKQIQKSNDLKEVKQQLNSRIEEDKRINKAINLLDENLSVEKNKRNELDISIQIIEDNIKQNNQKAIDQHNELLTQNKRINESREKIDQLHENIRRIDSRLSELNSSEADRRYAQKTFMEQQALQQVDRDQIQNELRDSVEKLGKQSQYYETQLQQWDAIQREIHQAQVTYEDLSKKIERRINEITEMQRLSEDRFRQEWATFKADYQKRWTSYSLSQDEIFKEMNVEVNNIVEKLAPVEDLVQTQQDILQQSKDAQEEFYQGVQAQINQLLTTYDRIISSSK
ncbi:hypothetical protein ACFLTX_01080 [Chloroflexota bacterium]